MPKRNNNTGQLVRYFGDKYTPLINAMPKPNLGIVVVIPCYNEPFLLKTLYTLKNCDKPDECAVEIIVVANQPDNAPIEASLQTDQNITQTLAFGKEFNSPCFTVELIEMPALPAKIAGVGIARKTGMDEAAYRFLQVNNPHGIIALLDADTLCEANYFTALHNHFAQTPLPDATTIYFEHPTQGTEYSADVYKAIAQYELYMRYYYQASKYAGLPFARYAIGSAIACTANAYAQNGGMNKRQAGEDFYFLQKLVDHGYVTELKSTKVIPSPRPSARVPFGTGPTIQKIIDSPNKPYLTYSYEAFKILQPFTQGVNKLFNSTPDEWQQFINNQHAALKDYLYTNNVLKHIAQIKENSSNNNSFIKRFYQWFNAFALVKYLNYVHRSYFEKLPLEGEAAKLPFLPPGKNRNAFELLNLYRKFELSS